MAQINYYININPTNKKDLAQILHFLSPNKRHNDPPDSSDSVKTKKRKVTTKCKQEIVDAQTKCLQPEVQATQCEYQPDTPTKCLQPEVEATPTKCEYQPDTPFSVLTDEFTPSMFTPSP